MAHMSPKSPAQEAGKLGGTTREVLGPSTRIPACFFVSKEGYMPKSPSKSEDQLHALRHSMAHILATAVQELYPDVKFGVGPVIESGFYYDFDLNDTISPADLPRIQKKMREVIKANYPFERNELGVSDAMKYFKEEKHPYNVELLDDLKKPCTP